METRIQTPHVRVVDGLVLFHPCCLAKLGTARCSQGQGIGDGHNHGCRVRDAVISPRLADASAGYTAMGRDFVVVISYVDCLVLLRMGSELE